MEKVRLKQWSDTMPYKNSPLFCHLATLVLIQLMGVGYVCFSSACAVRKEKHSWRGEKNQNICRAFFVPAKTALV
jgi:hypothetical protein